MSAAPYVVTGAASGIGREVAAQLLAAGHGVIALDRGPVPLAGVTPVAVDLADPASVDAALAALPSEVAGLANVAGVPGTCPPATVLAVNLLGPRRLAAGLVDRIEPGGAVVNVSSVAAHRSAVPPEALRDLLDVTDADSVAAWLAVHGLEGPAAYDTSKAALNLATQLLAADLLPAGRRALTVSPGPIETPILDDFRASMGVDAIARAAGVVGRHGRPEEIAAVVVFALGRSATWLNGVDVPVEGGLLAARVAAAHRAGPPGPPGAARPAAPTTSDRKDPS